MRRSFLALLVVFAALAAGALAAPESPELALDPAPSMAAAASAWLAGLDAVKRAQARLPFNSADRLDWHYVPRQRRGVSLQQMNADERRLALAFLRTGLSPSGFAKVESIRNLEEVLFARSGWSMRDPGLYFFTVFGVPGEVGSWGWRYEGHHASLHWTVVNGKLAGGTPQFLGADPADVTDGPRRGTRTLAAEEDLGRALVKALDPTRRSRAVVNGRAPHDILSGNTRGIPTQASRGILYRELTDEQQDLLLALIREHAAAQSAAVEQRRLAQVRADLPNLHFAWIGGLEKGEGHYYRIQGTDFLIEYDNTQNHANHIHTVWRDRRSDWGRDLLADHFRSALHHAATADTR